MTGLKSARLGFGSSISWRRANFRLPERLRTVDRKGSHRSCSDRPASSRARRARRLGCRRHARLGRRPRYFTRSAIAAQFFEDICSTGLDTLKEQTQAKAGVFGTNRVKGDSAGPVRGRLIAVSLRSSKGCRSAFSSRPGSSKSRSSARRRSQKLLALAPEFAAALTPPRPAIPEPPVLRVAAPAAAERLRRQRRSLDWSAFERTDSHDRSRRIGCPAA